VPVGFHHQYADPGIAPTWKFVHAVLTLFVAVPSLITAFTVAASLELAGRMRGGKGLFGWIKALPWDNPAFVAPVLGLIAFIPGGAGGIVNASYTLNYVVHNTTWVPGHLHLQVGTLVTMTMMGAVFWLVPQLTGKPLTEGIRKAGLAGVWLWFVGMLVMAVGMHWQGLLNVPRRAYIAQAPDAYTHAAVPMVFNILAGIILLLALVLFFYAFFALLFRGERRAEVAAEEVPFAEVLSDGGDTPAMRLLDRIWFWFALAVLLVVLAYGPTLVQLFGNLNPVPGMRLW
jgi:cytochrome c oxidase subunit 1